MVTSRQSGPVASRRSGAVATEMAILLPFLLLMFALAVDFGRVYCATQTVQECASIGAMYGAGMAQPPSTSGSSLTLLPGVSLPSLSPSAAATWAAVNNGVNLSPPLQSENVTVSSDPVAKTTTVTVQYSFTYVVPMLGNSVTLTRSATVPNAPKPGS